MSLVPDHNAARWLAVRWREAQHAGFCEISEPAGWYVVVRTCPCHWNHPVTLPLETETAARRAMAAMLSVSAT